MNDLDYVQSVIAPWIDKWIDQGENSLTSFETIGVGVWVLEVEVDNGGFHQYYSNSTGYFAGATVDALRAIGAGNTARLLAAANAEFPGAVPPTDRARRQDLLGKIDAARFTALEKEFYQRTENLCSLLALHLRANEHVS